VIWSYKTDESRPAGAAPQLVGRLAPSPTGLLHLGHARSFLLAWWSVRSRGGKMLLRIEDLDGPRVRPELAQAILRDLEWLGLDWDGAPYVQSAGVELIRDAAVHLAECGLAYACTCSRADVRTAQSAPQQGDDEPRYPGTCRGRYTSVAEALSQSGRAPGLRFAVSPGAVTICDRFAGIETFDVAAEIGDFLIARRDGAPAYQLAVVVDDAEQGVTEVLRADDLLPSAARQWHLQRALRVPHPTWIHVPLVTDETGRRLAKRRDDLSLAELREAGADPAAIVGWAAKSAGMHVDERLTAAQATNAFRLDAVPHERVALSAETVTALRASRV
jgi:glutamyl-tRNA synthetase